MKDIDKYSDFTNTVWRDPSDNSLNNELAILALGLVGESGEVAEKIKKLLHYGREINLNDMQKELGDVVYYWARICRKCGFDPSEVLQANIDKLGARVVAGTLWGEGSDR